MTQPYKALRMREFAKRSGLALLGGATAAVPFSTQAALSRATSTGSVEVISGGFKWFVNTNITFQTTSSNFGFSEADATRAMTTEHGAHTILTDAFDGALSWHVHPAGFSGDPGLDGYRASGGVTRTDTTAGITVMGLPTAMQGLNVTGQLFFPANLPVARAMLILQNPTSSAISVRVANENNLGSDSNTKIVATSNGDTVFQLGQDNWVTSFQNFSGSTTSDPTVTFAGLKLATSAGYVDGDDNPFFKFDVTVPAGETKRIMLFVRLSPSATVAQAAAPAFNDMNGLRRAGYLADMTENEIRTIVNWDYQGVSAGATAVPTLGGAELAGLSGLIGLAGAAVTRRRQRKGRPQSDAARE